MMKMRMKMKRKDFDQFYNDFSNFSLSSPATKIRRLDAELPPIMEEDDHPEIALSSEECLFQESRGYPPSFEPASDPVEGDFAMGDNQEKAIVLFKAVNPPFVQASTSPPLSLTVDSNVISAFKNEIYTSNRTFGGQNPVEDDDGIISREAENATNKCTTVVPWVPSQVLSSQNMNSKSQASSVAEAEEATTMDIEQDSESPNHQRQQPFHQYGAINGAWNQHHCMLVTSHVSVPGYEVSWAATRRAREFVQKLFWIVVLEKSYSFAKNTQVRKDSPGDPNQWCRHKCNGGWPFSTPDNGWIVSDCTAEGLKPELVLSRMPPEIVGESIEVDRLYDAVNVILSMQNSNGGYAPYELTRSYSWVEMLNPSEVFGDIMIDYQYVEGTSAAIQGLKAFTKVHPGHRRRETEASISKAAHCIQTIQQPGGSGSFSFSS